MLFQLRAQAFAGPSGLPLLFQLVMEFSDLTEGKGGSCTQLQKYVHFSLFTLYLQL